MNATDTLAAAARPLKLRRRSDLIVCPQRFGGRRYLAIKDPLALRYYHLGEEEYFIFQRLDGRTSAAQILAAFAAEFAPRRLKPASLQHYLGMLHREGLIVADAVGQGEPLLERRRQNRRRERLAAWSNPLAIRFRGFDPEPWLAGLYPWLRWLFAPAAVAGGLLLVMAAVVWMGLNFDRLQARLPSFEAFFSPGNLIWFAVAIAASKVLHELAHGLACKHFGGECHELGVMLLVFTPCLFVNVSDSWMLPDKWKRIAIAAAGMYAELVLAAVCTFVWWFSHDGLLNSLCLQLMFVSSVGSVLFNANPLLPYDGYYILADWLEVPNLRQRATGLLRHVLAWSLCGVDVPSERIYPERGRGVLIAYAVAAIAYRLFVVAAVLWFCHAVLKPYGLQVVAQLLTVLLLAGILAAPGWRCWRFLNSPTWSRQVKSRRLLGTSATLAAGLAVCLAIPLPHRVHAPVVLEPQDARRVFVMAPGTVQWSVEPGVLVRQGDVLAQLENPDLAVETERLRGQSEVLQTQLESLRRRSAQQVDRRMDDAGSQIPVLQAALEDVNQRLERRQDEQQRLVVRAPVDGTVIPPRRRNDLPPEGQLPVWEGHPLETRNRGAYLAAGTLLCLIGDPHKLQGSLLVAQADLPQVRVGQRVDLQIDQLPGRYPRGVVSELAAADLESLPPELAVTRSLPLRTPAPGRTRVVGAWYQATVELEPLPVLLLPGAVGRARIVADPQSLGRRIVRSLQRTFRWG